MTAAGSLRSVPVFTTGFINRWRGAQHAVTKGLTRVILKVQGMDEDVIQETLRTEDRRFAGEKAQREQEKQNRLAAIRSESSGKLAEIGQRRGDASGKRVEPIVSSGKDAAVVADLSV